MARTYYTLAERDGTCFGKWAVAFGSYDKDDVTAERDEMRQHGVPASCLKIITSGARQADINAAVAKLNAPLAKAVL